MLPTQREVEIPLLEVLIEIGGEGVPRDVYPLVTGKLPQITDQDLAERLPSGGNKWTNRIQWVRQRLVEQSQIDSSTQGVWRITEAGRQRVAERGEAHAEGAEPTFLELYEAYETSFRAHLQASCRVWTLASSSTSPRDY